MIERREGAKEGRDELMESREGGGGRTQEDIIRREGKGRECVLSPLLCQIFLLTYFYTSYSRFYNKFTRERARFYNLPCIFTHTQQNPRS